MDASQVSPKPQVITSPLPAGNTRFAPAGPIPLAKKGIVGRTIGLFAKKPVQSSPASPIDGSHVVAQAIQGQTGAPLSQPQHPISAGHPEVAPIGNHFEIGAVPEVEIIPETPEVSAELAEHVEAVEREEIVLPEPIDTGMAMPPLPAGGLTLPKAPNIILPITKTDFQVGAKQPVSSSWRWLIEWVKWIIKKHPGQVLYRT